MKIAVVVATYNRCDSLRNVLEALVRCDVPSGLEWDAWIIDNNSRDQTREVVEYFSQRSSERIHYLFESVQGKSHALNRGIRQAAADIVAFTDDDCLPDPHWIANIGRAFASNPGVGIIGGRVELFNPEDHPIGIRTSLDRQQASSGDTSVVFCIIGCNMAIRRELLSVVGDFDPLLSPGSGKDAGSEDADFVYRAFRKGIGIEYDPDVVVFHNHGRRSAAQVQNINRSYVRGRGSFYAKHIIKGDIVALKMAYWDVSPILGNGFKRLFTGKSIREDLQRVWFLCSGALSRFTR